MPASELLTDAEALNGAFGLLATHTGYFFVMLAFGIAMATICGLRSGGYA